MSIHSRSRRSARITPQAPKDGKLANASTPSTADVLVAIWSLYADELRPFGRILRKRVAEIHFKTKLQGRLGTPQKPHDVDAAELRLVCERSDLIRIEREDGGDWAALLHGVEERFVDVYSPRDEYSDEFWQHAAAYFAQLTEALPGGRYSCAKAMVALRLPFLAGFSLGRICHAVQISISQKHLLGHHDGTLVPYRMSRDMVKQQCAIRQRPCGTGSNATQTLLVLPLATLESARSGLRTLLNLSSGSVPLSNLKRLFRCRFRLELSETALGHSKLCQLLQASCFTDICEVRLEGNGLTVFQVAGSNHRRTVSLADTLNLADAGSETVQYETTVNVADAGSETVQYEIAGRVIGDKRRFMWPTLLGADVPISTAKKSQAAISVQNTFLHAMVPCTPPPLRRRRASSLPRTLGSTAYLLESAELDADTRDEVSSASQSVGRTDRTQDFSPDPLLCASVQLDLTAIEACGDSGCCEGHTWAISVRSSPVMTPAGPAFELATPSPAQFLSWH